MQSGWEKAYQGFEWACDEAPKEIQGEGALSWCSGVGEQRGREGFGVMEMREKLWVGVER